MRVLVTRPEPDASRTAEQLVRRGHRAIVDPLLSMELLPAPELAVQRYTALVVTSANAMRAVAASGRREVLLSIPLYAVGARTAEAARRAGFVTVHDAGGDAAALAALMSRSVAAGSRVLHLAGEDRARELGPLLVPAGIEADIAVLYRMRTAAAFGAGGPALAAGALDAALHFSSRSAATFVALAERDGLLPAVRNVQHLCLSAAVAAPLEAAGAPIRIAERPHEESLTRLLDS